MEMEGESRLDPDHTSSDELGTSDSDVEFSCRVCDKTFSGIKPLLQHEKGAGHLKALRRRRAAASDKDPLGDAVDPLPDPTTPFSECAPCGKQFSGPESYHQHLKGRTHKKQLARAHFLEQMGGALNHFRAATGEEEEGAGSSEFPPLPDMTPFAECRPCRKQFSGPESYHQHLKGRNHKKQLVGARLMEEVKKQKNRPELGAAAATSGAAESSGDDEENENDATSKVFVCEDCGKAFTGVDPFYRHLLSKVHLRTLRQKDRLGDLVGGEHEEFIDLEDDVLTCKVCKMAFSGPESVSAHLKGKGHSKRVEKVEWKKKTKASRVQFEKNSDESPADVISPPASKDAEDTKLQENDAEDIDSLKPFEEEPVGSDLLEESLDSKSSTWV